MELVIGAASWVLGKALASAKDGLVETWAASNELGDNLDALEIELLHAKWILDDAQVRQSPSPPLMELLLKLRQLAYDADDVFHELQYYRIQDALDGTYHATDVHDHDGGGLFLNARYTANAIGNRLTCCSFASAGDDIPRSGVLEDPNMPGNGRRFLSCAWPSRVQQRKHDVQTPKLKFDRVEISTKMKNLVEKLKPVCAKFSTILDKELLSSANLKLEQLATNLNLEPLSTNRNTTRGNSMKRSNIIPEETIDAKSYESQKKSIVDDITRGKYSANELTVLPVVGPGGCGKTTLTKHIYHEVKGYFHISIWICVSTNFDANRLTQEIVKKIPNVRGEKVTGNDQELIEQRLKAKQFLLVLDDMWTCHEDEWTELLVPFKKVGGKGNMIIVTTRFPRVAEMVGTIGCSIHLESLDEEAFRNLFKACVFGDPQLWECYPELHEVGTEIMRKLKGSPLAAKTIGGLLRNQLTLNYWTSILGSKEWDQSSSDYIMPVLKLAYDYLPFHLQQCSSYLSMFPENYHFDSKEIIHLWIGLDILNSCDENKRVEDIGLIYLNELIDDGFLKKEIDDGYVVHDLIHELARKVRSKECVSIYSSNVRSIQIPPSVRHLSIIVDDEDVKDRVSFERYKKDLSTLDKRLKIQNLRTLMLFGEHHGSFAKTFGDLFKDARALRAIFLSGASYSVEDILHNFSTLVHLRYLNIKSVYNKDICLRNNFIPSALCRLYHLEVIDLRGWKGRFGLTRQMSNLSKLRHFLVSDCELHADIFEVGKLKLLQELKRFEVKKENSGFELKQLEQLVELQRLGIYNLEKAKAKEEADEVKLTHKHHLHELILDWDVSGSDRDPTREDNTLESLEPHSNLGKLSITGHGGIKCPTWLGANLSVRNLEDLRLDGVAWKKFPPLGEMWMVNEPTEHCLGPSFEFLRRLELVKIPNLERWVGNNTCDLFSHLEVLIIEDCYELMELSFSHSTCCRQEQEGNITWFPKLQELRIQDCTKLSTLPPVPWTRAPCSIEIRGVGLGFERLVYGKNDESKLSLEIVGKDALDSTLWMALASHNPTELEELNIERCPPLPLDHLQMLSSQRSLRVSDFSSDFRLAEVSQCAAGGKKSTQMLSSFPKVSKLKMTKCEKITGLSVMEQATRAPSLSYSANDVEEAQNGQQQQQDTREEEEIAAEDGLLLLPPQLQELRIDDCPNLSLCLHSLDSDKDAARTGGGGGGLQDLRSLRLLSISGCPRLLSSYYFWSSSSFCFPFPASLEHLSLRGLQGLEPLASLSNLNSLTTLSMEQCGDLRGDGFWALWPLLAQGHLTRLTLRETPRFFVVRLPSQPLEQELPSRSSKLSFLQTDDVVGVLNAPICTLLSSSLTILNLFWNSEMERFTEEQEEALQHLTSLQDLIFWDCHKLRCLPARLHTLHNLKTLQIQSCKAISSLPKDGLPASLQELNISNCQAIRSLPKCGLPSSLQKLQISDCPGIRSLPKMGSLPSSLRELHVQTGNSKKLKRQCRKLIGTIPIVRA